MKTIFSISLATMLLAGCATADADSASTVIVCPNNAPPQVKLAAKELRRYIYLRTGELLPIASTASAKSISLTQDPELTTQVYRLKSFGDKGEVLTRKILALSVAPCQSVTVRVRPLGGMEWQTITAKHVTRAVYAATLPLAAVDFEYQIVAEIATGANLTWPATAPEQNQTVIIMEK